MWSKYSAAVVKKARLHIILVNNECRQHIDVLLTIQHHYMHQFISSYDGNLHDCNKEQIKKKCNNKALAL